MNKKGLIFFILISIGIILFVEASSNGENRITNINIYRNTPAWKLAKAVKSENTTKIEKIAKRNPELLDYQDPKYEATLLLWAVGMEKYESAEALLKCGANPNINSTLYGTALYEAAGYSFIDNDFKKDPKYVKLLLENGADPNINLIGSEERYPDPGTSPLMRSIGCGIEKTKLLVEYGADINYINDTGDSAVFNALLQYQECEYAYYLIVEKKAKVTEPYKIDKSSEIEEKYYLVDILRDWIYDLDSKEYKIKMEIVDEFKHQGLDYWDTEIPEDRLSQIKKIYPDTWEEYIKKY